MYHWVKEQATAHLVIVYLTDQESTPGGVSVQCFAVSSYCPQHDKSRSTAFQCEVLEVVKRDLPQVRMIHCFFDGAFSQYKNKNVFNFCYYERDHNFSAEWNFFATSHGRKACNGVGGTIKRLATKASLPRPNNGHIQTPDDLFFLWAKSIVKGLTANQLLHSTIQKNKIKLTSRFAMVLAVKEPDNCTISDSFCPSRWLYIILQSSCNSTEKVGPIGKVAYFDINY